MTPEKFNAIRERLKLSYADLAALLHCTRRQVIRYKTGESAVPGPVSVLMQILLTRKIPKLPS